MKVLRFAHGALFLLMLGSVAHSADDGRYRDRDRENRYERGNDRYDDDRYDDDEDRDEDYDRPSDRNRDRDRDRDQGNHRRVDKVSSLLFNCSLNFVAKGKSIYIGVGFTDIRGKGLISCYDYITGAHQDIRVNVKAKGPGIGLGVTGLKISGIATGVGVGSPEALLGRYVSVRGNAAAGVGAGAGVALRLSKDSVNLDVSVEATKGLGAGFDLLFVDISSDENEKKSEPRYDDRRDSRRRRDMISEAPTKPRTNPASGVPVAGVPAKVIYVDENRPVHVLDSSGRLSSVIVLRSRKTN